MEPLFGNDAIIQQRDKKKEKEEAAYGYGMVSVMHIPNCYQKRKDYWYAVSCVVDTTHAKVISFIGHVKLGDGV